MESTCEILVVAAETSSALYGKRLLEIIKEKSSQGDIPAIKLFGIGNREMESLGFEILGRSEEMAVVGLVEVIKHYPQIRKVYFNILEEVKKRKPKVALLMDYPEFNLKLAKDLKKLGIPVIYFISPQIWAWRTGRVHKIKKIVDQMLVVFPFEEKFYSDHQVPVRFVGHPLLDEIKPELFETKERNVYRSRFGVTESDIVLGLMPGSRNSELDANLLLQLETAQTLKNKIPALKVALLVAPNFDKDQVRARIPKLDIPLILLQDEPFRMIKFCDAILCASGTATLMVGLMQVPMVIMYRMKAFTAFLAKKLVKHVKFFGMVNLISEDQISPELFQEKANVENMAGHLMPLLNMDSKERAEQVEKLKALQARLGTSGAMVRVTEELQRYLQ